MQLKNADQILAEEKHLPIYKVRTLLCAKEGSSSATATPKLCNYCTWTVYDHVTAL